MPSWLGLAEQRAAHLWHPPNRACTLLVTALPGGLDRYFAEIAAAVRQQDNQAVATVNEKYGVTFFGD